MKKKHVAYNDNVPVFLSAIDGILDRYSQSISVKSAFKPGTSRFLRRNKYKTYAGMVYRASTCYIRFKSPKSFVTNSYVVSCRIELAHFGPNPVYGNGGTSGSPDSALLHLPGAPGLRFAASSRGPEGR